MRLIIFYVYVYVVTLIASLFCCMQKLYFLEGLKVAVIAF